jgi:uncharacterized protein (TIGR02266 family)
MTTKKQIQGNKGNGTKNRKTSTLTADPQGHVQGAATHADEEERTCQRVPIQLLVDYKSDGSYLFDFCKDLGTGGVFIQTEKPLPTGAHLDLTFTIPDSKETVLTKGTVIWSQQPVPDKKELVPGMGVQFNGFSEEQRKLLENFVQRYHGDKLNKKTSDKQRAG